MTLTPGGCPKSGSAHPALPRRFFCPTLKTMHGCQIVLYFLFLSLLLDLVLHCVVRGKNTPNAVKGHQQKRKERAANPLSDSVVLYKSVSHFVTLPPFKVKRSHGVLSLPVPASAQPAPTAPQVPVVTKPAPLPSTAPQVSASAKPTAVAKPSHSLPQRRVPPRQARTPSAHCVAGLHVGHDMHLAVFQNFKLAAITTYKNPAALASKLCSLPPSCVFAGDSAKWNERNAHALMALKAVCPRVISHGSDHHEAHAAYAFYTSPFSSAVVLAIDGGGDECGVSFKAFYGSKKEGLQVLSSDSINLGWLWFDLNTAADKMCRTARSKGDAGWPNSLLQEYANESVALPPPLPRDVLPINAFVDRCCRRPWGRIPPCPCHGLILGSGICGSKRRRAEFASALHHVMAAKVLKLTRPLLQGLNVEGVVLGGGVAYNARLRNLLGRALGMRIYAPIHPGDLTVGVGHSLLCHTSPWNVSIDAALIRNILVLQTR